MGSTSPQFILARAIMHPANWIRPWTAPQMPLHRLIFADLPGIDVRRTFLVEEVTQDIVEETMSLKVKVV